MTIITGTKQKQAWDAHELPPVEKVRPGLWSIPVPIPDNPLRYVLVYALELDGGIAIVDAGWNTDDAWDALCGGIKDIGAGITDVEAVVVTHIHPDHYGLAGRVREVSGAWVGLHPADAELLQSRYVDMDDLLKNMSELLAMSGVPADVLPDLNEASVQIRSMVSLAEPDVLLEDAQPLGLPGWDLRVIWTPGHSPGHVCLYSDERQLLLSGDHVLPRITPIIAMHTQQAPNPLGDYLESLARMRYLTPGEVLPAHEYRFADLGSRLTEIENHHADRLRQIEKAVAENPGTTSWDLTTSIQWSRPFTQTPAHMQRAANGETLAHLVLLETRGRVYHEPGIPARFYPGAGPGRPA